MNLSAADGDSKLQQREEQGALSRAGLCGVDSRALAVLGVWAERALAKHGSWRAGMCHGSTAGFYLRAGQG